MKKILIASVIIAAAFGCAKERTCTETVTSSDGDVNTSVTTYKKLSPKQRREIQNLGTYTSDNGTKHEVKCK